MINEAPKGWSDRSELVLEIQRLVQSGLSGTLFCTTADSASATLGISNGQVVALSYKTLRGIDALAPLAGIVQCRFRFKENVLLQTDDQAPTADQVLQQLGEASAAPAVNATAAVNAPTAASVAAQAAPPPAAPQPAATISSELPLSFADLQEIVTEEAGDIFGPLGIGLAKQKLDRGPQIASTADLASLLSSVSHDAGEPAMAEELTRSVLSRVHA